MLFRREGNIHPQAGEEKITLTPLSVQKFHGHPQIIPTLSSTSRQLSAGSAQSCRQCTWTYVRRIRTVALLRAALSQVRGTQGCDDRMMMVCGAEEGVHR